MGHLNPLTVLRYLYISVAHQRHHTQVCVFDLACDRAYVYCAPNTRNASTPRRRWVKNGVSSRRQQLASLTHKSHVELILEKKKVTA